MLSSFLIIDHPLITCQSDKQDMMRLCCRKCFHGTVGFFFLKLTVDGGEGFKPKPHLSTRNMSLYLLPHT